MPKHEGGHGAPWHEAACRTLTALFVVGAIAGSWIIWEQQRDILVLRRALIATQRDAAGALAAPPAAAPATAEVWTWDILEPSDPSGGCADLIEMLVVTPEAGDTTVVIPSLQDSARTSLRHFFEIVRQTPEQVVIRSLPCGVGLPVDGSAPPYDFWMVRRDERALRELQPMIQ